MISPSTEQTDRGRKMQLFARYGVPEYWIVDPLARTVEIHRLDGANYSLVTTAGAADVVESPSVAGLTFAVDSILPG